MAVFDVVSAGLQGPVAALRRHVISLSIAIVAAVAALLYAASGLLLALELVLGPIGARLAVAGTLLIVAVAAYFIPRLMRPSAKASEPASSDLEDLSRDQRIAMVLEALMLGFSMGSRKPAEDPDTK